MVTTIKLPREILIDSSASLKSGEVASAFSKNKKILIVSDENLLKSLALDLLSSLKDSGFSVSTYTTNKATLESVDSARQAIKKNSVDIIIGFGGGTCIDVAKLSSFQENLPFISMPTAPSHDGITSPVASIKTTEGSKSFSAQPPIAVIADTKILASAPVQFLPSGCGDAISNLTAVKDWELSAKATGEDFHPYAAALSKVSAETVINSADLITTRTESAVELVVQSLVNSGIAMCMAGSSRPCSGAEHAFSHVLDQIAPKPAMHGEQCAVGSILTAYLQELDWERIRNALKTIGTPITAKELKIDSELIVKALSTAHKLRDRYTILGKKGISTEKARKVAEETGVI